MAVGDPIRKLVQLILDKNAATKMEGEATKSLSVVDKGFARLKKAALGLGATLAAAFAVRAVIRFGKEAVRVAIEAEAIWNRLGKAVESVGENFAEARPEIDAFARAMQDATTVGDEDFAAILTELITFSGDYAGSLRNVGAVADLAAAKQLDLRMAAQLVGKAMIGETSTLKRYGIIVEEGADAVAAMRKQFRGFAENEAKSFQGRLKQLSNEWGDFKQAVGDAMIAAGGGTSIIQTLTATVKTMTEWVNANQITFQRWGASFIAVLEKVGSAIQRKLDQLDPLGKKERDQMKEIQSLSENQLALDGKRFQLGQDILALDIKLNEELKERVRLEGLVDQGRMTPLAVRQSNYRVAALEAEIQSLQALIRAIDDVGTAAAGVSPVTVAPAGTGGGGEGEERKPRTLGPGVLGFEPDFGTVGGELAAAQINAAADAQERSLALQQAGWEGLNSEMEMSVGNAEKLAASIETIGEAAQMSMAEVIALNAAADLGGGLVAALFGSDLGKLAAQKAEQNAIMAAEQLAMAAAVAFIPGFQGEAAGHIAAAGMFAGVAAAWGALAGATGGFSGGGGGSGSPRDTGGAASERTQPPGDEVHIYFVGPGFSAVNPEVQKVVYGAAQEAAANYGPNTKVKYHRRPRG